MKANYSTWNRASIKRLDWVF